MSWLGKWKNQFGSIVEITGEANERIEGTFRTALKTAGYMARPCRLSAHAKETALASRQSVHRRAGTALCPTRGYYEKARWRQRGS